MLTTAQQATLAAHICASTDQDVIDALAIRNDNALAALYNQDSTFVVWRTSVPVEEYRNALTWTEVDALTIGKARIWEWITGQMTLPLEPYKDAVRQGLADCWSPTSDTRAALIAISKRFATLCESLFTTGTGTDATPGLLVFEGLVTSQDIGQALNNNPCA